MAPILKPFQLRPGGAKGAKGAKGPTTPPDAAPDPAPDAAADAPSAPSPRLPGDLAALGLGPRCKRDFLRLKYGKWRYNIWR